MRLSAVVELLLILLLVAFAAYGRVIDSDLTAVNRSIRASNVPKQSVELPTISQTAENVNRYCTCSESICNCCRDFHIPLVQLQGPGCASLQYLQGDNLAVQLSFGDNILTSTIVNGKSPKPVCVPLPGGFTKFCGRVYSIKRDADNHFKACLGLELQSATELEASLRVSCFRFGPDGLKLRPAEPLPVIESEQSSDEDDDDDIFGLVSDDDDDDTASDSGSNSGSTYEATAEDDDDDDDDILGFGALLDIITGEDDSTTKKPKVTTPPPLLQFTIPILTRPTVAATVAATALEALEPSTDANDATIPQILNNAESQDDQGTENDAQVSNSINEETITENALLHTGFDTNEFTTTNVVESNQEEITESTNKMPVPAKLIHSHKVKRVPAVSNKKPSITSSSINAINDDIKKKKPLKKPIKDEDDDYDGLDDDDDDDDDDVLDDDKDDDLDDDLDDDDDDDDEDDNEDDNEKHEEEDEDEKAEDLDDLDDDDDEEEDAVLSALVEDDKPKTKKNKAVTTQSHQVQDDEDYGIGITDFLARKRQTRPARQSKVMRL